MHRCSNIKLITPMQVMEVRNLGRLPFTLCWKQILIKRTLAFSEYDAVQNWQLPLHIKYGCCKKSHFLLLIQHLQRRLFNQSSFRA